MSSIPSLESIYGSLTADITANTAKLERLGNQTDIVEDEFGEEDNVEKSEDLNCTVEVVRWHSIPHCSYASLCFRNFQSASRHREG